VVQGLCHMYNPQCHQDKREKFEEPVLFLNPPQPQAEQGAKGRFADFLGGSLLPHPKGRGAISSLPLMQRLLQGSLETFPSSTTNHTKLVP
jgi:hypothetical protein